MTTTPLLDNLIQTRLRPAAGRLLWVGIAMTIVGVLALIFPMVSTLAVTLFISWVLLFTGAFTLAGSFSIHGTGPFFAGLLLSLLSIALGLFIGFNPAAGAEALTLGVGIIFAVQAAYEFFFAFEFRPSAAWMAMLISAIASALVAALIIAGWPSASVIVLGILFGVNFITTGVGYIVISRSLKAA